MVTVLTGLSCLLIGMCIGMCIGIHLEYRHGYLDRRLHKPWPKPRPVVRNDYIDDCEQFTMAMIETRALEGSERLQ
jgi:hypothetical protein